MAGEFTLLELSKIETDPGRKSVIDTLLMESNLMELVPWETIGALSTNIIRMGTLPSVGFRKINAGFSVGTAALEQKVENISLMGGFFDTDKATKKRCAKIVTDPTPLEDPKDPTRCNVFALLQLLAGPDEIAEIEGQYRAGGYGYGSAKGRLAELINDTFANARERYAELEKDPDLVRDVLREGGAKARETAEGVMERVREACGIITNR